MLKRDWWLKSLLLAGSSHSGTRVSVQILFRF
jgi:hypothetical protein